MMVVDSMFTTLQENLLDSSWLEAVAVVFGLLSVWYARKENILVYPTGIVNVLIYVYLCFNVKLYADAGINLFYFAMSIYGWYMWVRKDAQRHVRSISRATAGLWAGSIMAALVFFAILSYVLKTYTDSSVPYWDGLTTAIFIVGMWLMALKKVENWIFWIAGDLISVPLYASKGLILSGIQFAVFLALAIAGLIEWERKYRETKKEWSGASP
jgi:nicotinamide mononucleotide transporter